MQASEFDKFASEYLETHRRNVALTGEDPEYFARYKVAALARRYQKAGIPGPRRILDFGCGVGNSVPHLRNSFPNSQITALDVSETSLSIAQSRFPGFAEYTRYDGLVWPDIGCFDLIYSSCVFHHIDADEHTPILEQLKGALSEGGVLAIFEHNPINPVSRYIVATCPFDENAVLIPARRLVERQTAAGFRDVEVEYTGFFPGALRALRGLEPWLGWLPLGAQYCTVARA